MKRASYDVHVYAEGVRFPVLDDNVDVEVTKEDGSRWSATFFTVKNVSTLLTRWKASGENCGGLYFYGGRDAIVVDVVTPEVIERVVECLFSEDEFESVFARLSDFGFEEEDGEEGP